MTTLAPSNSTAALFRAWGLGIHNLFVAAGLVQTADTGQINWSTVPAPSAGNIKSGFEIWQFSDALQIAAPVTYRIDYGSASTATVPSLWHRFGTGTNGAGALLVPTSNEQRTSMNTASATPLTVVCSGANNRLALLWGMDAGNTNGLFFGFERTKSVTGDDTSLGVLFSCSSPSNGFTAAGGGAVQEFFELGVGSPGTEVGWGMLLPTIGGGVTGAEVAVFPLFHAKGVYLNYGTLWLGYFRTSVPQFTTIPVGVYNVLHTYIATQAPVGFSRCVNSGVSLLMRYE